MQPAGAPLVRDGFCFDLRRFVPFAIPTILARPLWVGLAALSVLIGCGPKNKPVRPVRKDITQAVYASGKVYPAGYYRVTASLPGYLDKVYVHVGDTVQPGEPLFTVRNQQSQYGVETSRNTLELARRNATNGSPLLIAAQEDVDAARAKYRLDSTNYARYINLQSAGAGTRQALDQARTLFETSKSTLQRAQANLEATRLRVQTEYQNAQSAYNAQTTTKNDFTVTSTIQGMVYDQVPRPGEYVGPTSVVMELGQLGSFEVELAIDETDLNFVHPGQEVVYGADAFGKQVVKGRVKEVYPKISPQNKSIKAIATIDLPSSLNLYAGSTLEANIVYARRQQVLVLPRTYVVGDSVTLRRRGKYRRQKVETGLSDVQYVEIVSGIDANTDVYRP